MSWSYLFLAAFFGVQLAQCEELVRIALERHSDSLKVRNQTAFVLGQPRGHGRRDGPPAPLQLSAAAVKPHAEWLQNFHDMQYVGELSVGTPKQKVRLVFDTGSSDLWVVESKFDAAASSSWKASDKKAEIQYGKGNIKGTIGSDDVCLRGHLCVDDQSMLVVEGKDVKDLQLVNFDGILGLAFIGLSHSGFPFLRHLSQQFEDLSFAFSLKDGPGSYVVFGENDDVLELARKTTGEDVHIEAQVKDVMETEYGLQPGWWLLPIRATVLDVSPEDDSNAESYWIDRLLPVFLVIVLLFCLACCCTWRGCRKMGRNESCCSCFCACLGSTWFCLCGAFLSMVIAGLVVLVLRSGHFDQQIFAAVDTGTSLIVLPQMDYLIITELLFGEHLVKSCQEDALSSALVCACDIASEVKPLSLEIGGVALVFPAGSFFMPVGHTEDGREVCLTGLAKSGMPALPIWILGDVFLRHVYAVHNFKRRTISFFPQSTKADGGVVLLPSNAASIPARIRQAGPVWILLASLVASAIFCFGAARRHLRAEARSRQSVDKLDSEYHSLAGQADGTAL